MIIPKVMYFVMFTHLAVNVHVNMGANGNPIKAVKEGSIILFKRATSTSQRKSAKSNQRVEGISRPGVFRDRNQIINYCEFLL